MLKYEQLLNTTKRNVLIKLSRFITIVNNFSLLNTIHIMYFYCIIIVNLPHSFKLYEKNTHIFHGQVESECNKD